MGRAGGTQMVRRSRDLTNISVILMYPSSRAAMKVGSEITKLSKAMDARTSINLMESA